MAAAPKSIQVPAADLHRVIRGVLPYVSSEDEARLPALACIHVHTKGGWLVAEAADRETWGASRVKTAAKDGFELLLPASDWRNVLDVVRPDRSWKPVLRLTREASKRPGRWDLVVNLIKGELGNASSMRARWHLAEDPFPSLRHLVKFDATEPAVRAWVKPKLMARFEKSVRSVNDSMTVHMGKLNQPVTVTIGDYFVGVLSPIRMQDPGDITTWFEAL